MVFKSVLTVVTSNIQGAKTQPGKLGVYYGKITEHTRSVYVLTETNLDQADLDSPTHIPPKGVNGFSTRAPDKQLGSGVTILLGEDFTPVHTTVLLPGFVLCVEATLEGSTYLVVGVYSPPQSPQQARDITASIQQFVGTVPHTHLLVAGDLNASLRPEDRGRICPQRGSVFGSTTRHDHVWRSFVTRQALTDAIAKNHPNTPRFSYTNGTSKAALDHILLSASLARVCHQSTILTGVWKVADHYPVSCQLRVSSNSVPSFAPTTRRVPVTRLAEVALQDAIEDHLADTPVWEGTDTAEGWQYWRENVIAPIVHLTVQYHITRTAKERRQLTALRRDLQQVRDQLPNSEQTARDLSAQEQQLNERITKLEQEQASRTASFHNRVAGLDLDGDNYAARVLASRKLSGTQRNMIALTNPNTNTTHTNTLEMMEVARDFYQELLGPPVEAAATPSATAFPPGVLSLSQDEQDKMRAEVTLPEVEKLFSLLQPKRAPGPDGIPNDLYKAFKDSLAEHFLPVLKAFQAHPFLPADVRDAIIAPVYKGKGERELLTSWRPITLVNTDYKLVALFQVLRLTPTMARLVAAGQTSSVPGRTTFDNVHATRLALDLAIRQDEDAAFLFLDSEKAFDRVSWPYLWATLNRMGIPPEFVTMTKALYVGAQARVRVNGHITSALQLGRGVRQGCPVSPLLYVLSLEPIRAYLEVRASGGRRPAWLPRTVPVSFAHADDLGVIANSDDVPALLVDLQTFACARMHSGYKNNRQKSVAIYIQRRSVPPATAHPTANDVPSYFWRDHQHRHLGLPIGGVDPVGAARAVALGRIRSQLALIKPCNIPYLQKARALVSRYAGSWQFYAQTVPFTPSQVRQLTTEIRQAFWGPPGRTHDFVRQLRLFLPRDMGGAGLLYPDAWLGAFRRDFYIRLQRAVPRPDWDDGTTPTDRTVVLLFKEAIRVATANQNPPCDPSDFFWLPPEVRAPITQRLPEFWKYAFQHFEDTAANDHTMTAAITGDRMPPDVVLGAISFLDRHPTQDPSLVPAALRATIATDPDFAAARTLRSDPAYMMPIRIFSPPRKGRVRWHYRSTMQDLRATDSFRRTPEIHWLVLTPSLADENNKLIMERKAHERALTYTHGKRYGQFTSHAWLLYQQRLLPAYYRCPWCTQPKDRNASNPAFFLHIAWDCPRFQAHWQRLCRSLIRYPFEHICQLAIGVDLRGNEVRPGIRKCGIALHAALWRHRSSGHLPYGEIITLFKKLLTTPPHYGVVLPDRNEQQGDDDPTAN